MIWPHGEEELKKFNTFISNYHPTIKFITTYDANKIPFLDTITYIGENNYLLTRLYHKPTDKQIVPTFSLLPSLETKEQCTIWAAAQMHKNM